jgi:hypothetical protein
MKQVFLVLLFVVLGCVQASEELTRPPRPICARCPSNVPDSYYYTLNRDTCECVQKFCAKIRCTGNFTIGRCSDKPCSCCVPRPTVYTSKPNNCANSCPAYVYNKTYYIQNKDTCKCEQKFCSQIRCARGSTYGPCPNRPCLCCLPISTVTPTNCAPCPPKVGRYYYTQNDDTCECERKICLQLKCIKGYRQVPCKDKPCLCCEKIPTVAPTTCAPCPANVFGRYYYIQNKDTCECERKGCRQYKCKRGYILGPCADRPCSCCLTPPAPTTCAPCPANVSGRYYYIQNKDTCECEEKFCPQIRCLRGFSYGPCVDRPCTCCFPPRPTEAPPAPTTCAPCPANISGITYYIQNKDTCECQRKGCKQIKCSPGFTITRCKDIPCSCCVPRSTTTTTTTSPSYSSSERSSSEHRSDESYSEY